MFDVGAVVEFRQHAEQAETADRSPADEFDEAIGWIGVGRYQHGAAGEFAVVEGEKQAATGVPFLFVVGAQDEGATLQLRYADENTDQIAEMAERLENTIGDSADIGSESDALNVEGINLAGG